jgi:hypothetical protein
MRRGAPARRSPSDGTFVDARLAGIAGDDNLSRYIL